MPPRTIPFSPYDTFHVVEKVCESVHKIYIYQRFDPFTQVFDLVQIITLFKYVDDLAISVQNLDE